MFWKLLLTAAVILGAYVVIRARIDRKPEMSVAQRRTSILPRGSAQGLAYALAGLTLAGTGFYLFRSWDTGREVLRVQVVNANTGVAVDYQARRRDIEGRGFRTLEGQVIRLADVERMVLTPTDRPLMP